jgi:hypothetical protein
MTQRTGTLSISMATSRLNGLLLAVEGAPNPVGSATSFLLGKGFSTNSFITVTGRDDSLGNLPVFFMINAFAATPIASPEAAVAAASGSPQTGFNPQVHASTETADFSPALESNAHITTNVFRRDLPSLRKREKQLTGTIIAGAALLIVIALLVRAKNESVNSEDCFRNNNF